MNDGSEIKDKNDSASVTVIIVNWNSGRLLEKCVRHLEHQTVHSFNVLVIDNASSDGSADITGTSVNLTILNLKTNLGFAAGNNFACANCATEFIALLNPDAFPEPDWLASLLDAAKYNPCVAAFGSRQVRADDPKVLDGLGDVYHLSGLVWRKKKGLRQQEADLIPQEIFSPCAAAALYRRQVWVEVGGFDEDYFCYVEDVDLGFRLRLAGYKAMYVPNAVVHHVGSGTTGGQRSDFSVYHGHRNLVWTYVKNMPGWLFWGGLPLHLIMNILIVIVFMWRGKGRVIFRAKYDAMLRLPIMWRKRKKIQNSRVASAWDIWRVLDKKLF